MPLSIFSTRDVYSWCLPLPEYLYPEYPHPLQSLCWRIQLPAKLPVIEIQSVPPHSRIFSEYFYADDTQLFAIRWQDGVIIILWLITEIYTVLVFQARPTVLLYWFNLIDGLGGHNKRPAKSYSEDPWFSQQHQETQTAQSNRDENENNLKWPE